MGGKGKKGKSLLQNDWLDQPQKASSRMSWNLLLVLFEGALGKCDNEPTYHTKDALKGIKEVIYEKAKETVKMPPDALQKRLGFKALCARYDVFWPKDPKKIRRKLPELTADPVVASFPSSELVLAPSCLPIAIPTALLLALGFL